jgi:hypothetical protein
MRRVATGFTENSEKLTAKFTKLCAKSTKEFVPYCIDYSERNFGF